MKFQCNLYQNTRISAQENEFENVLFEMVLILYGIEGVILESRPVAMLTRHMQMSMVGHFYPNREWQNYGFAQF